MELINDNYNTLSGKCSLLFCLGNMVLFLIFVIAKANLLDALTSTFSAVVLGIIVGIPLIIEGVSI